MFNFGEKESRSGAIFAELVRENPLLSQKGAKSGATGCLGRFNLNDNHIGKFNDPFSVPPRGMNIDGNPLKNSIIDECNATK